MRQKSTQSNASVEKTVRDIRRKTRRWHSTEEKIWIVVWRLTILSALLVLVELTWLDNGSLYKGLIQSTFIVLSSLTMQHMVLIDGFRLLEKLDRGRIYRDN